MMPTPRLLLRVRAAVLGAALLSAFAVTAAEPAPAKSAAIELFPDLPVVKGKGFEIKASELERAFMEYRANQAARGQAAIPEAQRREIEDKLLARMIVTRILVSKARPDDKAKGEVAGNKAYADLRQRAGTDESFKRQVESMGMTTESLKSQLIERGVSEEVFSREVKNKIAIPDADVAKYYTDNPARFEQPEKVRISLILKLTVDPSLLRVPNAKLDLPEERRRPTARKSRNCSPARRWARTSPSWFSRAATTRTRRPTTASIIFPARRDVAGVRAGLLCAQAQ